MFDLSHLANDPQTAIFLPTGSWQSWCKPRGIIGVSITLVSGGGGGGGGAGPNITVGGGGGGGSSGISQYTYPALVIPGVLFVKTGRGGAGSIAGSGVVAEAGGNGELSYVSLDTNTTAQCLFGVSGAAAPGGAVKPVGGAGGAGGAAGTIATVAGAVMSNWASSRNLIAGIVGTAGGGWGNNGISFTPGTGNVIMPGLGGAGVVAGLLGGVYVAVANTLLRATSASGPGFADKASMYTYGGSGGNAFDGITVGGGGGNGGSCGSAIGAGGGGGGSASGGPGGRGGDGGPGLVIISWW
jgi:hypothetical protein